AGDIPDPREKHLGDVIISVEQAQKQAKERNKTLDEEMEKLLIHGILHLLGYDHERSRKDAKIMQTMERTIHERVKK
ncbi:MAG: rRNA maturation RNase YbeY, partial [Candidatus Binatia bacterium]